MSKKSRILAILALACIVKLAIIAGAIPCIKLKTPFDTPLDNAEIEVVYSDDSVDLLVTNENGVVCLSAFKEPKYLKVTTWKGVYIGYETEVRDEIVVESIGKLTIHVVDSVGVGIDKAIILIRGGRQAGGLTDENGFFTIELPEDVYVVEVVKGHVDETYSIPVTAGEENFHTAKLKYLKYMNLPLEDIDISIYAVLSFSAIAAIFILAITRLKKSYVYSERTT